MKICHMTSNHKNTDTRIFQKECSSLAKKDNYEVYLVAQGASRNKNGVHIIGTGDKVINRLRRMLFMTKEVYKKSLELDADIYHLHDPELLPYALRLKKRGKIVIFDSHEDYSVLMLEKKYIPFPLRKPVQYVFNIYQNKVLSKLDAVIGVTPHLVEKLEKINKKTVLITNYPIVKKETESMKKQNYSEMKENILVFAGGISEQWSHEIIISVLDRCKDVHYKMMGRGRNDYLEKLKKIKGYEKTIYLGEIPYDEVKKELKNGTIGLAIAQYNNNTNYKTGTLGNTKLFEEMLAEIPVICTDFILWKDIIEKYQCGICVNPYNMNEIETAITWLVNNPEKAKKMGKNGKRAVVEEFNWERQETKLFKLYEHMVN